MYAPHLSRSLNTANVLVLAPMLVVDRRAVSDLVPPRRAPRLAVRGEPDRRCHRRHRDHRGLRSRAIGRAGAPVADLPDVFRRAGRTAASHRRCERQLSFPRWRSSNTRRCWCGCGRRADSARHRSDRRRAAGAHHSARRSGKARTAGGLRNRLDLRDVMGGAPGARGEQGIGRAPARRHATGAVGARYAEAAAQSAFSVQRSQQRDGADRDAIRPRPSAWCRS